MLTIFSYALNGHGHAKKEHSNVITFKSHKSIVKINCVTFTVTEARVNPSQPSHIELGKQLPHYHSNPMKLIVAAGRKKSKAVGGYFYHQVGKHNLIGWHLRKLNFVVRGALVLFQDHACIHKVAEFNDIFIAQTGGLPFFFNDWLVGGKSCFYNDNNKSDNDIIPRVDCKADYNPNRLFWSLERLNNPHTIDIVARNKHW